MAFSIGPETIRFYSFQWLFVAWAFAAIYRGSAGGDLVSPMHIRFQSAFADGLVWLASYAGISVALISALVSTLTRCREELPPLMFLSACIELNMLILFWIFFFIVGCGDGQVAALLEGGNSKKSIMCSLELKDGSAIAYEVIETPPMTSNEFLLVRRKSLLFGLEREQQIFRNSGYSEARLELSKNKLVLYRDLERNEFDLEQILKQGL